jgi:hypothetical protein
MTLRLQASSQRREADTGEKYFSVCRQAKSIIKGALFRELFSILLPLLFIYLRFINYVG